MNEHVPQRLTELITDQIFTFALEAQRRLGTDDLVVILDLTADQPELSASERSAFGCSSELALGLRAKLGKPASSIRKEISSPHLSFWFLAIHSDEQMDCVALNASILGPAGTA